MGFMALDVLSERINAPIKSLKFKALIGEGRIGTQKVILLKPQTFMNLSGVSIRDAAAYYKVEPSQIIVIYDDVDLPLGQLRIRAGGSAGSHNGMKSVIYQLRFDNFPRIRIGLGDKGSIALDSFVMGVPAGEDAIKMQEAIERAAEAIETIVLEGIEQAQQKYNIKIDDN